jgi:hypothetical protein
LAARAPHRGCKAPAPCRRRAARNGRPTRRAAARRQTTSRVSSRPGMRHRRAFLGRRRY